MQPANFCGGFFVFMKKRIFFPGVILALFIIVQGRPISAEDRNPRIISLAPSTTEILFALGLDAQIVGVSTFCNYPPEVAAKEKIGTFSQPNIEKILSLKPDLIFCTGLEQAPVVRELKQLGFDVYVSDPANFGELFRSIIDIGKRTQREKEAALLIAKMQAALDEIGSRISAVPLDSRPRIFVEIWNEPLMTAGKGSFVDELITLAGGVNIAYDAPRPYSYFNPEHVIRRNPDVILLTYMVTSQTIESLKRRLGWQGLSAVRHNRIYNDISSDILLRPGPRLAEGLKELNKRLYP